MPLSEFYRIAKGKIEANQQRSTPSSIDLSLLGDTELVELLWENGQIMMQGQSNKGKKSPMNSTTSKIGKFGTIESLFNDFGVSTETGLNQDDELIRWLNYPVDENPQPDYCSELLPELFGVTTKEPPTSNNFTLIDNRDRFNPTVRDSSSFGSGISDPFSTSHHGQANGVPNSNSSVLNFSHFLRPAANARANLENIVGLPDSGSSGFSLPSKKPGPICQESVGRNENSVHQTKGAFESEKTVEPMVASSSVCSASSVERASNDLINSSKRKSRNSGDSEWQSEDIDEESVGVKKVASGRGGTSSKRSRAAEVHNLSERRRRDRINEKMRALQELIPNCSKVDKASMLDEAIEYLKSLQLQVQIMAMGAGLYMPPMILPNGMQHINGVHHLPHFSMGYGIGIQGPHFHRPRNVSGPASFQGLAESNLWVFGHHAQGQPVSGMGLSPSRTGFQATKGGRDQSAMVQKDDKGPVLISSGDV